MKEDRRNLIPVRSAVKHFVVKRWLAQAWNAWAVEKRIKFYRPSAR